MTHRAISPSSMQTYVDGWQMSPAVHSHGHLFFTGFTGIDDQGHISDDVEMQIRLIFEKIKCVLHEAGLDFGAVVEMTSYHIGLKQHLELFKSIRAEYVREPYPAWTAIEVAGFVREAAMVEIRIIARASDEV